MSDFPFIPTNLTEETEATTSELALFSELAFDFETEQLKLKNGVNYLVYRNEAIKIWVWHALNPRMARYSYNAYSTNYGNEFNLLLGKSVNSEITKSELKRIISEALLVNPYIKSLRNFTYSQDGSKLSVEFEIITIYGDITYKSEYSA